MEQQRNDNDRRKPKNSEKKPVQVPFCPPQTPHGTALGANLSLCGEKPVTNRLFCGTAHFPLLLPSLFLEAVLEFSGYFIKEFNVKRDLCAQYEC
jgi:hypothetical protein